MWCLIHLYAMYFNHCCISADYIMCYLTFICDIMPYAVSYLHGIKTSYLHYLPVIINCMLFKVLGLFYTLLCFICLASGNQFYIFYKKYRKTKADSTPTSHRRLCNAGIIVAFRSPPHWKPDGKLIKLLSIAVYIKRGMLGSFCYGRLGKSTCAL